MTWTTRPCSRAVPTTASHHAGGGHRRGVGKRRRGPGRGGVPHPPSPSSRAAAAWGKAARVPNGSGPSVAACRCQTRRRAWRHVRRPTTPAGTRVDLGRQAIHPQASPSTAARCSRGVRGAAGWARNVHRWTRVPRQVAEAGRPDVRTRLSPNGPPMMDRGLVDIHPPSRGAATPTVRQRGGPAPRRGGLGAEARRGGTRARGNQRTAGVTVHTRRVPRPAPRLHPRGGRPLSRPPTRRVATGACPVVHRGRPAVALIGDGDRPDR